MQKSKNLSQMHSFLNAVYHYQCMWHVAQECTILAPVSSDSGKKMI